MEKNLMDGLLAKKVDEFKFGVSKNGGGLASLVRPSTYDKDVIRQSINYEEFFRSELGNIKVNGKGEAMAVCCFHSDKTPSLSINVNTGMYHCFGCGAKGDAYKFRQLKHGEDFPTALKYFAERYGAMPTRSSASAEPKREVKTYDYRDEKGELLFQTVRYEPKDFKQRRPDGKGGWIWNLEGVRLIPYRLQDVLMSKAVIIVEGEKDVDNLRAWGSPATTSPMGAGKWKKEYNEHFREKNVVILQDNDSVGKKHAQTVAANLNGIAKTVRIIALPGLSEKEDFSSWKERGGTKEKLIEIIKQTPKWTAPDITVTIDSADTSIAEWPEPIPLDKYACNEPFPTDSLPSPGREMVKAVSKNIEVDEGLTGSLYLAALSTCLGGKVRIDLGPYTEPCNLYLVQIAESGEGKSPTVSEMIKPIYDYQKMKHEEMMPEFLETIRKHKVRELRLAKLLKKAAENEDEHERMLADEEARKVQVDISENPVHNLPVYIIDDVTTEKLGNIMSENGERIGIVSAEGGMFDIMTGLYSDKTNLDIYLKGHAGDSWSCHRIGRDASSMKSPALTISTSIQGCVMQSIGQDKRLRGRGVLARFLYSFCQAMAGYRSRSSGKIPESLKAEYAKHLHGLLDLTNSTTPLTLSVDAQVRRDEFAAEAEHELRPGGLMENMKDWGSKLPGAVGRIAALLHCAEHGNRAYTLSVSKGTFTDSIIIGGYFMQHAIATFGFMGEDPRIEKAKLIRDYLKQHRPQTFQGRDILRNKNAFKVMADVTPALQVLVERNYIRVKEVKREKRPEGGRPEAPEYEVNSKIFNFGY